MAQSVIMVIQNFYPHIGGAEKQCLELSKALAKRGVTVKVFTERWKGLSAYEEIEGIPVKRLGRGGPRLFHSIIFMASVAFYLVVRSRTYDVIHVHMASSHAVSAAVIGKLLRKKVLVLLGGGNEVGEIALAKRKITGRLKLWALGVLLPHFLILNRDQMDQLRGYNLEKAPVTLVPNGVDTDVYFALPPDKKRELRGRLGWKGTIFVFTGRFSSDKIPLPVLETFLRAWQKVRSKYPDIYFYLVGQGLLYEEYQLLIKKLDLGESVALLKARDNVSELYQAADFFALPSLTEGHSNSLIEAMASGLPVVASRVSGIVDTIQEGVHGYLFDPRSIEETEMALLKTLTTVDRNRLGAAGRATALNFTLEKTAKQYLELYGFTA